MSKSVVGVDIGATAIRAAEVSDPGKRRPTLEQYHEVQLPDGAVKDGTVTDPHVVISALKELWRSGKFKSKDVALGVGNKRVMVRDLSLPAMPMAQLRESLAFQVEDLIPVAVSDALLDFYPVSQTDSANGPLINGLLVAAIKEPVMANVDVVKSAGLNPAEIDLIPFAQVRALARRGENSKQTVALIDIGANTTNVAIVTRRVPQFVRIIASGGADVTAAISAGTDLAPYDADRLKWLVGIKPGDTTETHRVAELAASVVNPMLISLRDTIGYYNSTHQQDFIRKIVLTGGAAALPGLIEGLANAVRTPVAVGDPLAELEIGRAVDRQALSRIDALTVALGLALGENDELA